MSIDTLMANLRFGARSLMHAQIGGVALSPDEQRELVKQLERMHAEQIACAQWRKLALQFDQQRMSALWHLRAMLLDPAGHADQAKAFLAAAPPRQGGEHHIRQRDLLLAELEHLARACTKDDPEAYYCEVHPDHVERAERVVKRVRADMSKTELP